MSQTYGNLGAPATEMVLCVPSDSTVYGNPKQQIAPPNAGTIAASPQPPPRFLYVSAAGNLVIVMAGPGAASGEGAALTIPVQQYAFLPWVPAMIKAATTAQIYLCW